MQDSHNHSSVMVVKRDRRKLPSIRRHALTALICILAFTGLAYAGFVTLSNPNDAVASGEVGLDPVPLPPSSDSLNGQSDSLPDLLAGVVPSGQNPTQSGPRRFDALGNPIGQSSDIGLAGAEKKPARPAPSISSSGPRTILIDGKPIDGAYRSSPLVRAPLSHITRSGPFGRVPTPAADGRKAITSYARPFTPTAGKNTVSIVIGGLGIDRAITKRAIYELPPEVTLSFAAHTPGLQNWINQARSQGHEILLELPMESENFDPNEAGADHALKVIPSAGRNIRNLDWLMSRGLGYFAVTNYNGDKLLTRADNMAPILAHLSDAGLGFIFDGSISAPSLPALAQSANLPFEQAYALIDATPETSHIETQLIRLEAQASSGEGPIGVGFAYPATLDAVKIWLDTLPSKSLQIAPASHRFAQN